MFQKKAEKIIMGWRPGRDLKILGFGGCVGRTALELLGGSRSITKRIRVRVRSVRVRFGHVRARVGHMRFMSPPTPTTE